ncbi:ATP-binding protein [Vogesella sp. LIG4]|uniref:ATP-binding protein n=1 Tax=Vogesella sp. LIG4 TaxID=1192162 RepID=UPI00081FD0E9|nr:ATP-binding protein [Vogesella sp. LIG4]SCK15908.1 two-component system, sensor histidine kinase RegB [Vogesella sp. LIG4]
MTSPVSPFLSAGRLEAVSQRLYLLRWAMLGSALLLLLLAFARQLQLPWLLLWQALTTLALLNLSLPWLARRALGPRQLLALGLAGDVLVLTELLAFSGGAANPLASLYLLPVLFGALLLPARQAWGLALASLGAYAQLFAWHLPWPLAGDDAAYAFRLHQVGMWLTFAVSVLLLTLFVSYLVAQLQQREAALAAAREAQLRNEQLVGLGVQAAAAAHMLSTPLGTLTLLCDEMLHDASGAQRDDLLLMQRQLQLCREALVQLRAGSSGEGEVLPVCRQLELQLQGWHSTRPQVRLLRLGLLEGGPALRLDARFWPALFNLLNNAADAAGSGAADSCEVELSVAVEGAWLRLDIHNRRGSLSAAQLQQAGLAPLDSGKPAGLGLGVLLSHATLSQLGGELKLDNDPAGGVRAIVRLPLDGQSG